MPTTTKRTRGNVGKSRNELESKSVLTRAERIHYKAYKKNVITLQTVLNYSPRLAEYMKGYEKK